MPVTTYDNARVVNILHLSDLHCQSPEGRGNEKSERRIALDSLLQKLRTIKEEGSDYNDGSVDWTPDFVAISGDVAWSGKREEYLEAERFIASLRSTLDLKEDQVIMCPGNHDRDWQLVEDRAGTKVSPKTGPLSAEELNPDNLAKDGNVLVDSFGEFRRFCENVGAMRLDGIEGLEYLTGSRVGNVREVAIEFVTVNSAWYSRPAKGGANYDLQRMWLGSPLLDALELDDHSNAEFDEEAAQMGALERPVRVVLCHHPPDWLHPEESQGDNGRYRPTYSRLASNSQIVLSGHVHGRLFPPSAHHNYAQVFSGGATYTENQTPLSCNFSILQIDFDNHSVSRRGFQYDSVKPRWSEDEDDDKGTWLLRTHEPPVLPFTDPDLSLEGEWHGAYWQELKRSVNRPREVTTLELVEPGPDGRKRYASNPPGGIQIRGEQSETGYFSGHWSEALAGGGTREGTFQLKIQNEGNILAGRWVGYDRRNEILTGYWRFHRAEGSTTDG